MESSFHYLLLANQSMMHKQLLSQLRDTGLTLGQPKVLEYLHAHDGAHQAEIARACHVEAATLTSLLNRMEERGLLERRTRPGDRRSYFIFLTPAGGALARRVEEAFRELEETAFRGVEEADRQRFLEMFRRISANLRERES